MNWSEQEVLITGGTGTLGKMLIPELLGLGVRGIRVLSRDELKQSVLRKLHKGKPVSFLLGDIRDLERLKLAMRGVTIVINAAAMKHIDACEMDPLEATRTNVTGVENVIRAAIHSGVDRVMHISTDKAVYPTTLYGATKACAERLMIHANVYGAMRKPLFSCCRYGNVLGSRGSVVSIFRDQYEKTGKVQITDRRMTRFWITADKAIKFIIESIECMDGGEIFIPFMGARSVIDLAKIITAKDVEYTETGIRPGEKLHECIVSAEERPFMYFPVHGGNHKLVISSPLFAQLVVVSNESAYTSENARQLSDDEIRSMLEIAKHYE